MNFRPIILDRYLFREFLVSFLAVMGFCTLLVLVGTIFDKFDDIMEYGASLNIIVMFFLTGLPGQIMQIVPIASMLAVLFSVGGLARTNEILAMLTSGVHGLRLAVPILLGGAIIVAGSFIMNEYVVPPVSKLNNEYEIRLEDRDLRRLTANANVFARGKDQWFYIARVYSSEEKSLTFPTVVNLTPDHSNVRMRIEADSARFIKNDKAAGVSHWTFNNPRIWHFDNNGHVVTFKKHTGPVDIELEEDLPAILTQQQNPDQMNFHQLQERIRILDLRNQPVHSLKTDLLHKITFPLGIILVMLIGFGYAVRARAGTAMTLFGYGILWAVAYYVVSAMLQALGRAGTIPPLVATLAPTLAFTLGAVHYLRKSYRWHA